MITKGLQVLGGVSLDFFVPERTFDGIWQRAPAISVEA